MDLNVSMQGGGGQLARRLKRLFQPLIFPLIAYLLVEGFLCDDLKYVVICSLKSLTLILPYTWFVAIIAVFYVTYSLFRNRFDSNWRFDVFLIVLTEVLSVACFVAKLDGTVYVSNIAFAMGVIYKQREEQILAKMKWWTWMMSIFVVLVCSLAYVHGNPPFRGFAMLAVPLYIISFMLLYARVGVCDNGIIRFFKSISYEVYLWQSIPLMFAALLKINNVWLHAGFAIVLSVLFAFVAKKAISKLMPN